MLSCTKSTGTCPINRQTLMPGGFPYWVLCRRDAHSQTVLPSFHHRPTGGRTLGSRRISLGTKTPVRFGWLLLLMGSFSCCWWRLAVALNLLTSAGVVSTSSAGFDQTESLVDAGYSKRFVYQRGPRTLKRTFLIARFAKCCVLASREPRPSIKWCLQRIDGRPLT